MNDQLLLLTFDIFLSQSITVLFFLLCVSSHWFPPWCTIVPLVLPFSGDMGRSQGLSDSGDVWGTPGREVRTRPVGPLSLPPRCSVWPRLESWRGSRSRGLVVRPDGERRGTWSTPSRVRAESMPLPPVQSRGRVGLPSSKYHLDSEQVESSVSHVKRGCDLNDR